MSSSLDRDIRAARTSRNAAAVLYYEQHSGCVALNSYETFIDSWAGELWYRRNLPEIKARADREHWRWGQTWKIK